MQRLRIVVAAVVAAVCVMAAACDKDKGATRDAGPRYVPVDGGHLRGCYTEAACDGLHAGDRCFFPQPHAVDAQGFCGRPEPPCVVSRPFCGLEGKTIYACRFPSAPWKHEGPCADASAP